MRCLTLRAFASGMSARSMLSVCDEVPFSWTKLLMDSVSVAGVIAQVNCYLFVRKHRSFSSNFGLISSRESAFYLFLPIHMGAGGRTRVLYYGAVNRFIYTEYRRAGGLDKSLYPELDLQSFASKGQVSHLRLIFLWNMTLITRQHCTNQLLSWLSTLEHARSNYLFQSH